MKLWLEEVSREGDDVVVRLVAFNDSTKTVTLDRRLLAGPNGVVDGVGPWPVSLEPPAKDAANNTILLSAHCLYGRDRRFTLPGAVTFHGYLARRADGFLPEGPPRGKALLTAQPLSLEKRRPSN